MRYAHIFGPVRSRRLGLSLGIDLIPAKTCSLECIYCECGPTNVLTLQRREYVPAAAIIAELEDALDRKPKLNYVTLGGSGEPTLNTAFTPIVHFLKRRYPDYRVALLTNGTLLGDADVREGALSCDVVLPSLDAVSEEVFCKVNKPAPTLTSELLIERLVAFSKEYRGQLWLEVFIVPGVNDTPEELALFKKTIQRISADRVQLNSLDRPGIEPWLQPASPERLREIARFLRPIETEIIARAKKATSPIQASATHARDRVLATIGRRPCTAEEIAAISGLSREETQSMLGALVDAGTIKAEIVGGTLFYRT